MDAHRDNDGRFIGHKGVQAVTRAGNEGMEGVGAGGYRHGKWMGDVAGFGCVQEGTNENLVKQGGERSVGAPSKLRAVQGILRRKDDSTTIKMQSTELAQRQESR